MTQRCSICNNELEDGVKVCPFCGYHLLESTVSFKPVKVGEVETAPPPSTHRFDVRIVRGPQTGSEIVLSEGKLSVGRDPRCDVFLNDMTVSRMHATIEVKPDGCVIRDENSFNGVWINDRMVEACSLKPGDLIQIGAFCLLYRERL